MTHHVVENTCGESVDSLSLVSPPGRVSYNIIVMRERPKIELTFERPNHA